MESAPPHFMRYRPASPKIEQEDPTRMKDRILKQDPTATVSVALKRSPSRAKLRTYAFFLFERFFFSVLLP
jgi:hypothetical protein